MKTKIVLSKRMERELKQSAMSPLKPPVIGRGGLFELLGIAINELALCVHPTAKGRQYWIPWIQVAITIQDEYDTASRAILKKAGGKVDEQKSVEIARLAVSAERLSADAVLEILDAIKSYDANQMENAIDHLMGATISLMSARVSRIDSLASQRGTAAAKSSHSLDRINMQKAREWYAARKAAALAEGRKPMSKEKAAEEMRRARIVPASCRTIRGYLTGQ